MGAGDTAGVDPGGAGLGSGVDVGLVVGWAADGDGLAVGDCEAEGVGVPPTGVGDGVGAVVTLTIGPSMGAGWCWGCPSFEALNTSCQFPAGSIVVVAHVPFVGDPATSGRGSGSPPSPTISTFTPSAGRAGLLLEYSTDKTKLVAVVPVGGDTVGFDNCDAAATRGGAASAKAARSTSPTPT